MKSINVNGQDIFQELQEEMADSLCLCMDRDMKKETINRWKDSFENCFEKVIHTKNARLESTFEAKTDQEHFAFFGEMPKALTEKIFIDCPAVGLSIHKQDRYENFFKMCTQEVFSFGKGLIKPKKVCECSANEFFWHQCENQISMENQKVKKAYASFAESSLKSCIKENIEFIFDASQKNRDEYLYLYKEIIAKDDSFESINTNDYCECYFSCVEKRKMSDDEVLNQIFYNGKTLKRNKNKV